MRIEEGRSALWRLVLRYRMLQASKNVFHGDYIDPGNVYIIISASQGTARLATISGAKRTIVLPVDGGESYTVSTGITTGIRMAAYPAAPSLGDTSSNYIEGGTVTAGDSVRIDVSAGNAYLAIQLLTNTEVSAGLTLEDVLAGLRIIKG